MVTNVVGASVVPVPRGPSRLTSALPRPVSSSEWTTGNCTRSAALAIQLHGAGNVPNDRLIPKYIATIIAPTPNTKAT